MKNSDPNDHRLSDHIRSTYFSLRRGMVILSFALPLLLWLGGLALGIGLEESMSAYYFAQATNSESYPLRSWFVGLLFAIGGFLWLYKGFTDEENTALNLAGVCAWLVALFPTVDARQPNAAAEVAQAGGGLGQVLSELSVHGASAVLLFLSLAWVAWRCASDTLDVLPPQHRHLIPKFRRSYKTCAVLMVVLPAVSFFLGLSTGLKQDVFFAEMAGVWVFAAYWWIKHRELQLSHAVEKALAGALDAVPMNTPIGAPATSLSNSTSVLTPAATPLPSGAALAGGPEHPAMDLSTVLSAPKLPL